MELSRFCKELRQAVLFHWQADEHVQFLTVGGGRLSRQHGPVYGLEDDEVFARVTSP